MCKLNTRCSIIAATNAKGKYDVEQSISVNVALGSPLLSRFDIILVLLDTQNDRWDETVSSYILDQETDAKQANLKAEAKDGKLWSLDKLQAYIAYVKSSFSPVLTEESNQVLKRYYQLQRQADVRNAARTTIRLLESLIRIAQAHAKLMCRHEVSVCDAVVAVTLMEASFHTSTLTDIQSTMHSSFGDDPSADHAKQGKPLFCGKWSKIVNGI